MEYKDGEAEAYRLQYRNITVKRVERSLRLIEKTLAECKNPYVAVSWGKDSCAMLHLVLTVKPDIPVVWIDRGEGGDIPDIWDTINWWRDNYNIRLIHKETPYSIFGLYEKFGFENVKKQGLITKQLKATFREIDDEYCFDCSFWGIRAEEAPGRAKMINARGAVIERKNGRKSCAPLARWTAMDVWAYIYEHGLETMKYYDIVSAKPLERNDVRYSNWSGYISLEYGRLVKLKRYYPDLFNTLKKYFPQFACYV